MVAFRKLLELCIEQYVVIMWSYDKFTAGFFS